ncbi:MAG: YCF48-related protein [Egibacteraceae bacterium]
MNRFQRVLQILDEAIGGPGVGIGAHGAFWRGLTRDQFVAHRVFGRDLLIVGQGAASNLVKAFKGEAPFGRDLPSPPPGATIRRMPAGLPPVSAENIAFIEQWIDEGGLEDDLPEPTLAWRPTNAEPASSRYDDIWFLTPQLGWAVNSNGQILRTTDGGANWEEQFHNAELYLRCIGFASASRGWMGTLDQDRQLYETRDGGATWSLVPDLPPLAPANVCGLSVVSESVVYASGTNYPFPAVPDRPPRMMKTVDGGVTWTAWDMTPHASLLVDTYFTSPECGWVVGGKTQPVIPGQARCPNPANRSDVKPVVLYTEDGGQTWVNRVADIQDEFPFGEWGWKIFFVTDQVGYVSLENFCEGAVLKTTDGGQTWQRLAVDDPQMNANLEGVGFVDADRGWVGGWGSASFQDGFSSATVDGGQDWGDANEIGLFINRFRFLGNPVTVGYAAGRTVYKYSAEPVPVSLRLLEEPATRFLDSNEPMRSTRPVGIHLTVPADASRLAVTIWERFGALVRHLLDEAHPAAGSRTVEWDVTNDVGEPLEPGNFILRVTVDDRSESLVITVTD